MNASASTSGSSSSRTIVCSRSIVRVAFACSGHSTMPWWFVAAGNSRKIGSRSGERYAVSTRASRSTSVRLWLSEYGRRASVARASSTVAHVSNRYLVTIGIPKPSPRTRRPPNVSDTASPASFMPSRRPHRQSLIPITRRSSMRVDHTIPSNRDGA